ncbi:10628_t:CDS:2, partial [Gigaspora rosea]
MSPTQNTHKKCSFCNKNIITTLLIDIHAISQILKNNKHEIIYEYAQPMSNVTSKLLLAIPLSYRAKMQECNCLKGKKFCFCDSILLDLDFWYIPNSTDTRPMSNSIETTSQNGKKRINVQIVRKDINL